MADEAKQKEILKNLLEPLILQLIKNKPMYGYEMMIEIKKIFGHKIGPSTIYPILSQMEKSKYISYHWDIAARPRKIYNITEEGKNVLTYTEQAVNLIFQKTNPTPVKDI